MIEQFWGAPGIHPGQAKTHRTAGCLFCFFHMKVRDILQRALGDSVCVRLKPGVRSLTPALLGADAVGRQSWLGRTAEPASSLWCQVCCQPGWCKLAWIAFPSHGAQGELQWKEILCLIEQRRDLVK